MEKEKNAWVDTNCHSREFHVTNDNIKIKFLSPLPYVFSKKKTFYTWYAKLDDEIIYLEYYNNMIMYDRRLVLI